LFHKQEEIMPDQSPQRRLLSTWLDSLRQIPEVEVVWLEGSLVDRTRANPGSGIDIRLAITDDAYERLWSTDKTAILAGLGPILRLIDAGWIRALTLDGLIVELAVYKTSQLAGLQLSEWEFLLNRLPPGQPAFQKLPSLPPAQVWPEKEPLTREWVWQRTEIALVVMANAPGAFYNGEWQSVKFTLDDQRTELLKLMYRRIGIYFAKRYKHLSEVRPPEFQQDLASTYQPAGPPLDPAALAVATVRLCAVYGKHLQALSHAAGGGFEPAWYWRLYAQTIDKLRPWLDSELQTAPQAQDFFSSLPYSAAVLARL
jgi:hypothetical protein